MVGIQVIRAFKQDGITKIYNYTGNPIDTMPVHKLKEIVVSPTVIRVVDDPPKKLKKKVIGL